MGLGFDLFSLQDVLEEALLETADKSHYRKVELTESAGFRPFAVNIKTGSKHTQALHGKESYSFEKKSDALEKFKAVIHSIEKQGYQLNIA